MGISSHREVRSFFDPRIWKPPWSDAFGDPGGDLLFVRREEPGNFTVSKAPTGAAAMGPSKQRHRHHTANRRRIRTNRIWRFSLVKLHHRDGASFSFPMIRFLVFRICDTFCCSYRFSKNDNPSSRWIPFDGDLHRFGNPNCER